MKKTQEELIEVFNDTFVKSQKFDLPKFEKLNAFQLQNVEEIYNPRSTTMMTNVTVANLDCMIVAERMSQIGKTCILNMASFKKPGGGVKNGRMAQEEELARRSNLMMGLPIDFYPMKRDEFIYSSNVTFFKNGEYQDLERPFVTDVITVAALDLKEWTGSKEEYENVTRSKINAMLLYPANNGCTNLILSAFGCGVFKNDPSVMSNFFKDFLSHGFSKRYDNVVFAIINDDNSVANNYSIFKSTIC